MRIIPILICVSMLWSCSSDQNSQTPVDPMFGGQGNIKYDPLTSELVFDGIEDGYFLNIESQLNEQLIFVDDPGRYKLEYPGNYELTLLKDDQPIAEKVTFQKGTNYGSKYTFNTNLENHGFDTPLYGFLNDGLNGSENPRDGQWWCWNNQDAAIVIDLGSKEFISLIRFRYYEDIEQNIFPPSSIIISGSYDGVKYTPFVNKRVLEPANTYFQWQSFPVNNNFRYYRIDLFAHQKKAEPDANPSYLVIDEIYMREGSPPDFKNANIQLNN